MFEKELISVVLPIYNVEKYLEDCIESVRRQTYRNLEIILVDDGSTDRSSVICDNYLQIDSRVKVIHKKNGGLSDARNVGIKASTGLYIALIDSDDLVAPEFIEDLYKQCMLTDSHVAICRYCRFENEIVQRSATENNISVITGEEVIEKIYQGIASEYGFVAWNKLYHRSLFENIKYPVGKIYEDTVTTYKLLLLAERVVLVGKPLYFYRVRPDSIMTQKYSLNKVKDGVDADSSVVTYLYNHKYMELLKYASPYFCKQTIYAYYKISRKLDTSEKKEARQYLRLVYRNTWIYCKKSNMGCLKKIVYGAIRYIFWMK